MSDPRRVLSYVLAVCSLTPALASAQPREIDYAAIRAMRIATAVRITEPIILDGRLDEAAWTLATPATDFLQKLPNNGAPASERTEARFLYDDDNLYIGIICFDSAPAKQLIKDLKE